MEKAMKSDGYRLKVTTEGFGCGRAYHGGVDGNGGGSMSGSMNGTIVVLTEYGGGDGDGYECALPYGDGAGDGYEVSGCGDHCYGYRKGDGGSNAD
jgi:hypothetical protein